MASPISLVAFWVSPPSTNHNAVDNFFFGLLKRHKNKNKNWMMKIPSLDYSILITYQKDILA